MKMEKSSFFSGVDTELFLGWFQFHCLACSESMPRTLEFTGQNEKSHLWLGSVACSVKGMTPGRMKCSAKDCNFWSTVPVQRSKVAVHRHLPLASMATDLVPDFFFFLGTVSSFYRKSLSSALGLPLQRDPHNHIYCLFFCHNFTFFFLNLCSL